MSFDAYLFFDGECREAIQFYASSFGAEIGRVMTYGEAPGADPNGPDAERVIYSDLALPGTTLMCSDRPSGTPHVVGNNIGLSMGWDDDAKIRRVFAALADGGEVAMELGPTFFSPLYGMLTDKYGIIWQFSLVS